MKYILKSFLPGAAVTLLSLIINCVFLYIVANTGFFTSAIMWICIAALVLCFVGVFLLTLSYKYKVRFIVGCVLAALFITVQIFGAYYIATGAAALNNITEPEVEHAENKITDIKIRNSFFTNILLFYEIIKALLL